MTSFRSKKISKHETVGDKLKRRRTDLGIDVKDASEAVSIDVRHIEALEHGACLLADDVYSRCFLRSYASFLRLPAEPLFELYEKEQEVCQSLSEVSREKKPVRRGRGRTAVDFLLSPRLIKSVLIGSMVCACLGYLGVKVTGIVAAPYLDVESPSENLITHQQTVEVKGITDPEALLSINGQEVLTDGEGGFYELIDLHTGLNALVISSKKRHSKEMVVYRNVLTVPDEQTAMR